jgi:hypothetical protein
VQNLEAVELGLRAAMNRDLCGVLEQLLNDPGLVVPEDQSRAGEKCHRGRGKDMETIFGSVPLWRNYYHGAAAEGGRVPLDQALGLLHSYSPGLVRMMCRMGARQSFEAGAQDLKALAGVEVEGRQIQRIVNLVGPEVKETLQPKALPEHLKERIPVFYVTMDGTGVPMVPAELEGRAGKQEDGTAKTCEIKVGCTFTQTQTDEEGLPVRDYASTSYLVSFVEASEFGSLLRQEALRRGMGRADRVVVISDGAAGLRNIARDKFPFATHILDMFHALGHLSELAAALYGKDTVEADAAEVRWKDWLEEDKVQVVLDEVNQAVKSLRGPRREVALEHIGYVENNKDRMLYGTYRKLGLFYGSGVVEAGCRTVIGQRLKNSGMFWTKAGALNVAILRCALLDERFDQYWDRRNQTDQLRIRLVA